MMLDSSENGLPVGHDGVGLLEGNAGVVLFQVLQADLKVELTSASNDVLTGLLNHALHHGIGLGQTLKTFHELGKVGRVLGLNGHPDNRGHGELHLLHVVSLLQSGDGNGLDEELVNTNEAANVASRHILNGLNTASHHENGPLDGLLVEVSLLSRDKVWSHNPGLLSSSNLASEHTAECVEPALVGGGHHLGHVHHQGTVGVTVLDSNTGGIVMRSLIQQLSPVLLGGDGRWKVDNDHLEHSAH